MSGSSAKMTRLKLRNAVWDDVSDAMVSQANILTAHELQIAMLIRQVAELKAMLDARGLSGSC